jgi:hypothetical protein
MTTFSSEALRELVGLDLRPAVTIVMPTVRADGRIPQNPIRLKTLAREARRQLERQGLENGTADEIVGPMLELLDAHAFWRLPAEGVALFAGPNFFRTYQVAWPLREGVVVGTRFWVKPLLPALVTTQRYYILALSQHEVRLIEATAGNGSEVDLGDLPRNVDEALAYDRPEQNLQRHVVTTAGGEHGTAVHGHVPGLEARKEACRQFFHQVDRRVSRLMPDPRTPLVLAAVDYMLAIYQEVSTHRGIVPAAVVGSPEGAAVEVLAARAWEIVRPRLEAARHEARARYQELGPGLTSSNLARVLAAAAQGRVADLFVASDVEVWGSFDPETGTLRQAEGPAPGVEDLLNLAVLHTMERAGSVHATARDEVPGGGGVAALLRY